MNRNGFTLIDLITTLSVASILLAVGLPNFNTQLQQARVKTATHQLLEAIALTRTQAVMSSKRTTISKQNNWNEGWIIFIDTDNDGKHDADEKLIHTQEKLKDIKIIANKPVANNVSYIGTGESRNASGTNGGGFQAGTFTICPTVKGKGYELILAKGGRVRIAEANEDKCLSV